MTKHYQQLNRKEREQIFKWKQRGKTNIDIANLLGRNKSTIGRELKRNYYYTLNQYLPDTAQRKANKRKVNGRKQNYLEKDLVLKNYALSRLTNGWSPEQIVGRLKIDTTNQYYNHESIYQYIYSLNGRKRNLKQFLRRAHRIRRKKYGRKHHKGKIQNRIDIALRPKLVEKRAIFGHWEGDSMVFNKHRQMLSTHAERKTRFIKVFRPKDKTSKTRAKTINRIFSKLPLAARRTMTFDNGLEFADHEVITTAIGTNIYFAKPNCSWQRGTNENSNGLIRWYLPRKMNLDDLTDKQLNAIIKSINDRPRKCLKYLTPTEAFVNEMNKLQLNQ